MTSILKKRKQTRLSSSSVAADDNDEPYLCGICLQIMHDPCFIECDCRRSHCRKCLNKWIDDNDKCPSCNTQLNGKTPQPSCRQWSEFCDRVFRTCPNVDAGACKKFKGGDFKDLCNHLLVCPRQKIKCDNEECGQWITREKMKEHVRLCRLKRCANFIGKYESEVYGCGFLGTRTEVAQHETKCLFSPEALLQLRKLKLELESRERSSPSLFSALQ